MTQTLRVGAATMFLRELPVSRALEHIADAGYAAAEVWIEHLLDSGERPGALARQAGTLGLALTVHAASYDINPISRNIGIARESRRQIEQSLAATVELEAQVVVVHPGRRSSSRQPSEETWRRLLDWIADLDTTAARLGVRVGLELMENRPREIFMLPSDAARLMETSWQQIGLTVDVAHLNTHGDPVELLNQLEPTWIWHVHLSDQTPTQAHVPLGRGEMDLPRVLTAIRRIYSGIVSVEGYVPDQGRAVLAHNIACLRRLGAV